MEKNKYQKIEGKLYNYYRYKKEIGKLKSIMENLEKQIDYINDRIRNVHKYVNLDIDIPSSNTGEKVQTSFNDTSYFERELENEVTKLQREKYDKIKRLYRIDSKIRNMESLIYGMDYDISLLEPEDRKFIELKYKHNKSLLCIATELSFSSATAFRMKEKIISKLSM
ncbi:transcriptional regulator [uncultured Clostridium sp.]|uniref:transcriptional regulator n=1 Tax=uncultured Clostridium sp. TaxID=59620 RepID=UPI0025EEECEA|nr:transcriptional regulator [uncultured Clostridium sp.]